MTIDFMDNIPTFEITNEEIIGEEIVDKEFIQPIYSEHHVACPGLECLHSLFTSMSHESAIHGNTSGELAAFNHPIIRGIIIFEAHE